MKNTTMVAATVWATALAMSSACVIVSDDDDDDGAGTVGDDDDDDDDDDSVDSTGDDDDDDDDATGGSTGSGTCPGEAPSFAADVYPIISANCGCHVAGASGMLPMPDAPTAYGNLIDTPSLGAGGVDRVVVGDAAGSYFFAKVAGTQADLGGGGGTMPLGGAMLGEADLTIVEDWINCGAAE